MADFKAIENQEDFDAAIKKRLEQKGREVEKEITTKYEGYLSPADVQALKDAHENAIADIKKQLEELTAKAADHTKEVEEITARAARAESSLLKNRIAHENGVPLELADRLIGDNEDALKADAEKVAGFLKPAAAAPLRTTEPANYGMDEKSAATAALAQMLPQLMPPTT